MQKHQIEHRLSAALTEMERGGEPEVQYDGHRDGDFNASELFQRAYDQAQAEYEALQAELRELERSYTERRTRLRIAAAKKRALMDTIARQAR